MTIILIGSRIAVTIQTTKDRRAIRAVRGRSEGACQAALLRSWRLRKAEGRAVQGGDRELLKASTEKFLWMAHREPAAGARRAAEDAIKKKGRSHAPQAVAAGTNETWAR